MDPVLSQFAQRLKEFRLAKGWSQYRLAKEMGVGTSQIFIYEKGLRNPNLINLIKMSDALGITIDNLIGRTPP